MLFRSYSVNPHVEIEGIATRLTDANAVTLLDNAAVVLDGTDSFATRFAINTACHTLGVPLVSGAVGRWDGQVSVFASGMTKGRDLAERLPCYQCLVPEAPPQSEPCAATGIVGALTGVVGSMMALEAIKLLARSGKPLTGRVMVLDTLNADTRTVRLRADPECRCCGS